MKLNPSIPDLLLGLTKENQNQKYEYLWEWSCDTVPVSPYLGHTESYSNISRESFQFYHKINLNHFNQNCLCKDL